MPCGNREPAVLGHLYRDELRAACREHDLTAESRSRDELAGRLLDAAGLPRSRDTIPPLFATTTSTPTYSRSSRPSPRSKLLDLRAARVVKMALFERLAATWRARAALYPAARDHGSSAAMIRMRVRFGGSGSSRTPQRSTR